MAECVPVTEFRNLRELKTDVKQYRRYADSDLRPVNAVDTETYNGDIFLIADSDGRYLDKTITAESAIEFLFHKKYQDAWNFFYTMYDAEVTLKLLGDNRLLSYREGNRLKFMFGDYALHYIPNKSFRIKKGHHSVTFYNIAQFYEGSLDKAYQKNIGPLDEEYLNFKKQREEFSPRFYRRHTNAVRNYCIKDCRLTKALANKWIHLFGNAFRFYPQRWISSGYLAEKVLLNNGMGFPTFDSIDYRIQELGLRANFGGRFEIIKRGHIGKAYLYDINSAYPKAITELPDLTDGAWITGKKINPKATLGFFKILVNIPDNKHIPPFPFRANNILIFPSGQFITYVTLQELLACENPEYYEILESWQFIPNNAGYYPYKEFIEMFYNKRLELKKKDDPLQLPIKIILNAIYGKTGQKVNRVIGNLFNPVIFSYITGYTRAQLYRFIIKNNIEKEVVGFATDSICTTKDLGLDSTKLGEFSFKDHAHDVYYIQNGFYRFRGKWKQRGFGRLGGKEIENIRTYEKDGKLLCDLIVKRTTRLRAAIIQNKVSEIGKITLMTRVMNLNADRKRLWLGRLESLNAQAHNESMPLSLNYFAKEEI